MATNLALDDQLIREAQKVGKHKTKKEAVTAALTLAGKMDFDETYEYKKARDR